ncbi:hypothetical protein [Paraburkholderia bannensis]|uniref:hypothetical protein n=1 Tax=Paraburkholderia bannensis TaxID=765414 RepID=UPI002AC3362E|nr:hypothetical protein [Paraburkholderia bannensis]
MEKIRSENTVIVTAEPTTLACFATHCGQVHDSPWPAPANMQELLTVDQLSEYLRKSVASIRSGATRNPAALPPICSDSR